MHCCKPRVGKCIQKDSILKTKKEGRIDGTGGGLTIVELKCCSLSGPGETRPDRTDIA